MAEAHRMNTAISCFYNGADERSVVRPRIGRNKAVVLLLFELELHKTINRPNAASIGVSQYCIAPGVSAETYALGH